MKSKFEAWFAQQYFYNQLKYIHGDRLFDFDAGIGYRNATVQVGYVAYCRADVEFVFDAHDKHTWIQLPECIGATKFHFVCQYCGKQKTKPFPCGNQGLSIDSYTPMISRSTGDSK